MAIKAKIKAKDSGPLFIDFWLNFSASRRVFGGDHHHKKFYPFSWPISRFIGVGGINRERLVGFFRRFFIFRPLFPIEKVQVFDIFFFNMTRVDLTHNR